VREEAVVPFRVPRNQIAMGTEFRSTWLTASLQLLRDKGLFDRYLVELPREYHDPILHSVAAVWLPARVCVAHYAACDKLGISTQEAVQNGKEITRRLQKTIFSVGFRIAREAGITPFRTLGALHAVWHREWRGGDVAVFKIGPKDARIEIVGYPGAAIPYCRHGLRGIAMGMSELVCTKAYAQEIRELCTATTLGFRIAWA
jgi:hypothetical protein